MSGDIDFILQRDIRGKTIPQIGKGPWVSVYAELGWASGVFCALVPDTSAKDVLSTKDWELHKGDGGPEIGSDDESGHTYERISGPHGVEPLILHRSYDDVRPATLELSEEYRLFHNLFHDPSKGEFLRIMDDGTEQVVARVKDDHWELRLRDLRQYLAIRRMHLAVYFQVWRESAIPTADLPRDELAEDVRDDTTCYAFEAFEDPAGKAGINTVSKTIGKKLVRPVSLEGCGIWPYDAERSYESFIIGTDDDGQNFEHACDPEQLSNFFGKNKGAPHYLTPVFFRRDVLTRYFASPSKYKIHDGRLQCASLWSVKIDNNHPDLVVVMLGDLGRDLPEGERLHWKAHNVAPDGAGISEVNYRRNVLGEWTDADASDLVFKAAYERLHDCWEARFGWRLFKPLHQADEHCLSALRRLTGEEQAEFDEQIKNLTKLIVDPLNVKAIQAQLPTRVENEASIAKLTRWLTQESAPGAADHVDYLRALQAVRSKGSAHGKSSDYEKLWKKLGYEGRALSEVLDEILENGTAMLDKLRTWAEQSAGDES